MSAEVTSLSSPTGFSNPRMCKIAQEVGYHSLCIGRVGLAADYGDPFLLNRVAVKRSMTYFGEVDDLLADRPTVLTDPTYNKMSKGFYDELTALRQ